LIARWGEVLSVVLTCGLWGLTVADIAVGSPGVAERLVQLGGYAAVIVFAAIATIVQVIVLRRLARRRAQRRVAFQWLVAGAIMGGMFVLQMVTIGTSVIFLVALQAAGGDMHTGPALPAG
jgi:hypothetical protein